MEQNLTADQVINMLSGIVETGKTFAENVSMDTLFSSNDEQPKSSGYYSDPMSRRNDVGGGYSSAPYQPNARPTSTPHGNPYNYGYGYASDPVKYNSNQGYFSNSNPYAGNSRRFNEGRPNGYGAGYGNGSTSSSYGMGGASAPRTQQPPQSNPYQSSPYDERNYRFPDDMGFGGSFNRGGYGW